MGNYKLELISIHIPKTGGTSFRNTLQDVYGRESVQLYYQHDATMGFPILRRETRVLHGHIKILEYLKLIKEHPFANKIPIITWLRNPVERVISNYFYLYQILSEQLEPYKKETPGLQKRMVKSLEEFARYKGHQNLISRHLDLDWIKEKKLIFVGQIENYSDDLEKLASLLTWKNAIKYEHNKTFKKPEIDCNTYKLIEELNLKDIELYSALLDNTRKPSDPFL